MKKKKVEYWYVIVDKITKEIREFYRDKFTAKCCANKYQKVVKVRIERC